MSKSTKKRKKPVTGDVCGGAPDCPESPILRHTGTPLCQACWDQRCAEPDPPAEETAESPIDAPTQEPTVGELAAALESRVRGSSDEPVVAEAAPKTPRKPKTPKDPKPKRISIIDAAATILREEAQAMDCKTMVMKAAERGLWDSPGGATPDATLYSAIIREIAKKGSESRFRKVDRGRFESAN